MAINQIDAARFQAAYLRRDFGDGVPGSLNGRSVQAGGGAQVRASGRGLGLAKIGSLLGRVLNALTLAAGVRAESKYRLGVQDFSVALGRLMGDLRNQNGTVNNPQQLARQLADLLGKAGPVTSRGTSFPELLQARIDLHVEKLGIDDLIALHRSLQTDAVADAVKSLGTDKEKGEAGLVVGMLQRAVADRLGAMLGEVIADGISRPISADELKPAEIGGKQVTDVVHQFKLDVERIGPHQIYEFVPGGAVPDPSKVGKDKAVEWAANALRTLIGGNEKQMRVVSLYASQASLGPLMAAINNPEVSPLRLPNGDPVLFPPGGEVETKKWQISKDEASGDVIIKVDYNANGTYRLYNNAEFFNPKVNNEENNQNEEAKFYLIDPTKSRINFSYEIAVAPDGTARLRGPVSFDCNVEDVQWQDRDTAKWVLEKLTESANRFDGVFWKGLHAYFQTNHNEENTAFMIELQSFKQNPTLDKAQELFDRFIKKDDSDDKFIRAGNNDELNIDDSQRAAVFNALAQARQTGQVDPNMFSGIEKHVRSTLLNMFRST